MCVLQDMGILTTRSRFLWILSNSKNIKDGKEAFEDEIKVNKDVEDAIKHDIEKIEVEIRVIVENTVSNVQF